MPAVLCSEAIGEVLQQMSHEQHEQLLTSCGGSPSKLLDDLRGLQCSEEQRCAWLEAFEEVTSLEPWLRRCGRAAVRIEALQVKPGEALLIDGAHVELLNGTKAMASELQLLPCSHFEFQCAEFASSRTLF